MRRKLGLEIEVGECLVELQHAYSHFRITLHAFFCQLVTGSPQALGYEDWRWVRLAHTGDLAFSVANQRVIAALRATRLDIALHHPQNTA
jgi:hypothetical protein